MATISDRLSRATDSSTGRPVIAKLASAKAVAAPTISITVATNWTTTSVIYFAIYTLTAAGTKDPTSQTDWKGILTGTTISNMTLTGGTDRSYTTDAYVEQTFTAGQLKDLYDWGTAHADNDGTLKDGSVDVAAVLAANVVTTPKILDTAITPSKLGLNPQTQTVALDQTTASTTYTDLATPGPVVTVTIGANGLALVILTGGLYNTTAPKYMGYAITGATTRAATNVNSLRNDGTTPFVYSGMFLESGLTPGSNTFTAKYGVQSGTANFFNRQITVIPL